MDFDEEEPTQMELNPNPALHTVYKGKCWGCKISVETVNTNTRQ